MVLDFARIGLRGVSFWPTLAPFGLKFVQVTGLRSQQPTGLSLQLYIVLQRSYLIVRTAKHQKLLINFLLYLVR